MTFTTWGPAACASASRATRQTEPETAQRNTVDNNLIHDGGKIDPGAVGVWIGRTSYNRVSHNEICDLYYTGISVGWSWGYAPTSAHHNVVEFNHIHDIGRGVLGDMGGIYCLGDSPGTVLRNNLVHDVYDHHTGSLAIYTDEGSTGILIENNIGYGTTYANFHQHYGKENIVRNNIWALGKDYQLSRARQEEHISFTFERNIVYFDNGKLLKGGWTNDKFVMDRNLYWDTSHPDGDLKFGEATLAEWQARGHDRHSLIADPKFVDAAHYDFRLQPDSPAFKLGFVPIDASQIGLYGDPDWVAPRGRSSGRRTCPSRLRNRSRRRSRTISRRRCRACRPRARRSAWRTSAASSSPTSWPRRASRASSSPMPRARSTASTRTCGTRRIWRPARCAGVSTCGSSPARSGSSSGATTRAATTASGRRCGSRATGSCSPAAGRSARSR